MCSTQHPVGEDAIRDTGRRLSQNCSGTRYAYSFWSTTIFTSLIFIGLSLPLPFPPTLPLSLSLSGGGVQSGQVPELPLYSKYLLIAAYLASYNPSSSDKRFFSKVSQLTQPLLSGAVDDGKGNRAALHYIIYMYNMYVCIYMHMWLKLVLSEVEGIMSETLFCMNL